MNLHEKINQALKEAIRNKDEIAKNVLRGVLTAIKNKEKELKKELTDEDILKVLSSQVKQRKDSIEQFEKGGREDLVEREKAEMKILEQFLPQPLSEDELVQLVEATIKEVNAMTTKDMGKVMKVIMPKVAGRADGKRVNQLVREKLTEN